jgi:hypothetical protein
MPDKFSEIIREQLKEARGTRFDASDPDIGAKINRSIRESRGIAVGGSDTDTDTGPATQQQSDRIRRSDADAAAPTLDRRTARRRLLAAAAQDILDAEPVPGDDATEWNAWAWTRRVASIIDQHGRLPGEAHYNPHSTGPNSPDAFDIREAIEARRERWSRLSQL